MVSHIWSHVQQQICASRCDVKLREGLVMSLKYFPLKKVYMFTAAMKARALI